MTIALDSIGNKSNMYPRKWHMTVSQEREAAREGASERGNG